MKVCIGCLQGSCADAAPPSWLSEESAGIALEHGQCAVRIPCQAFYWGNGANLVWLDSLVFVYSTQDGVSASSPLMLYWAPQPASRLWITNSAFWGDTSVATQGLYVSNAPLYMEGSPCFFCLPRESLCRMTTSTP